MKAQIQGKKLSYKRFGKGSPVLVVHGWGGTRESLSGLAKLLAQSHDVLLVDLPGFGKSGNPDETWGVGEYARFLVDFLQSLKLKSVIYVGHSFGGTLGIFIAAGYPQLISKLVLLAPSYKRSPHKPSKLILLAKILTGNNRVLKSILYKVFYPASDLPRNPHLESNFRKIVTQDLTPAAQKIQTPTLILWGGEDTYVPVGQGRELHELIRGSLLKVFDNKRHGLPLKHPEIVYKEISEFV